MKNNFYRQCAFDLTVFFVFYCVQIDVKLQKQTKLQDLLLYYSILHLLYNNIRL